LNSLKGQEKQLGMLFHEPSAGHEGSINFPMKCTAEKQNFTEIRKQNITDIYSSSGDM
jgi:hypothetical protein